MALEIVIYGVVLVWLIGLLPAAIVTCLKGHWAMFAAGLLTLGLVWFLGALAAAELDSTWARRRYSEEDRARASGDARHRRPWRTLGITAAVAFVAIVVFGTFGARPAPVLGVNGGALEHSVGGSPCSSRRPASGSTAASGSARTGTTSSARPSATGSRWAAWAAGTPSGRDRPARESPSASLAASLSPTTFSRLHEAHGDPGTSGQRASPSITFAPATRRRHMSTDWGGLMSNGHLRIAGLRTGLAAIVAAAALAAAFAGCGGGSSASNIESSVNKQIEAGNKLAEKELNQGTQQADEAVEEAKEEVNGAGSKQEKEALEKTEQGIEEGKAQAKQGIEEGQAEAKQRMEEVKKQIEEATE
jgi:hypothetical protein